MMALNTALHLHIWGNPFFYLFIGFTLVFSIVTYIAMRAMKRKNNEMKLLQQKYVAKVDSIRKECNETSENLRTEMLKKEEDRNRQWIESEKETLHVLNGVSSLLDLSDKINRVDSERILEKLEEIQRKIEEKRKKDME